MVIYRATNVVNGKAYIGKTVKSLSRRRSEHRWYALTRNGRGVFASAIRKYGFDSFIWDVLEYCADRENLNERESYYINTFGTDVSGYNMTSGGDGAPYGENNPSKREDVKVKLRIANTGYKHTPEALAVMSAKSRAYFERNGGMPEEHRKKISQGSKRTPGVKGSENKRSKGGTMTSPSGEVHSFEAVREFATTHGLDHSSVSKVLNGKLLSHKGWVLTKIDKRV